MSKTANTTDATPMTDTKKAGMELADCASLAINYHDWHGTLFDAIKVLVQTDAAGNSETIDELAGLGKHLADEAWSGACNYSKKADAFQQEKSE